MRKVLGSAVRTSAFLRKETVETLRQPLLVVTLVLAPFLILLLFGIGLRDRDPEVATAFVLPSDGPVAVQAQQFVGQQSGRLQVKTVTREREAALEDLEHGTVDLVVVFPENALATVRANQRATVTLYHNLADPIEARALSLATRAAIDRLNQHVLQTLVAQGQGEARDAAQRVEAARSELAALQRALRRGDAAAAQTHLTRLQADVVSLSLQLPAAGLLHSPQLAAGQLAPPATLQDSQAIDEALTSLERGLQDLAAERITDTTRADLRQIRQGLDELDRALVDFLTIAPEVVVNPFRGSLRRLSPVQVGLTDYFAPGVLVLLVQHMLVTLVGLSVVRDSQLGTTELFRVAPLTVGELLLGKYLAHLALSALVSVMLLGLLVLGLGVPLAGSWLALAVAVLAVLFTSVSVGFFIALVARSDTQMIQFAMMLLLASIFLSGFVVNLDRVVPFVRGIAWALPPTYGVALLRDVMLRGTGIQPSMLLGLLGIGVLLLLGSWLLLRRRLKPSGSRRWRHAATRLGTSPRALPATTSPARGRVGDVGDEADRAASESRPAQHGGDA